jgi:hypothetical protein
MMWRIAVTGFWLGFAGITGWGREPERAGASRWKQHWAYQPVCRPALPAIVSCASHWERNPIDRFILARLQREGLHPSPEAERPVLIRRLSLDLIGLLPTPEEVDAFASDPSPDAYEKLVERLLASPHYGERWGRHWLDVARYGDSNGYSIDAARSIWPYRDWVITALNNDMPFDQFVIEQMAGDLLPNATLSQRTATGFHRNTPLNQEGGIDVEQFRVDSIYDRVNTTGTALLGLTVGCAQCHDHKYDPLTQYEYYQMFALLNQDDEPTLELASEDQKSRRKRIEQERRQLTRVFQSFDRLTDADVLAWQGKLSTEMRAALPQDINDLLDIAENGRDAAQKARLLEFLRNLDKTRHAVGGLMQSPWMSAAHVHLHLLRNRIEARFKELQTLEPNIPTTLVLAARKETRPTYVHIGGDFTRKGKPVEPGVPTWLLDMGPVRSRLDFARWLVDARQPLTPRVIVNRLWQHHFGLGLVETENDFGSQGTPPSHPELLDWLASEFVRCGYSVKHMHRLMVTSATYRQASKHRNDLANMDPRNRLLARMPRLRLEAEIVRDVGLCASGLLNPRIGGPSVFPPQPEGVFRFTQVPRVWTADTGPNRFRRGMYTHFWRSAPHPALAAFDAPDGVNPCTRRNRSNTPLQALTLLNDAAFAEMSQALARRMEQLNVSDEEKVVWAFRWCLSRTPSVFEQHALLKLYHDSHRNWWPVARALMNLDEFITRE